MADTGAVEGQLQGQRMIGGPVHRDLDATIRGTISGFPAWIHHASGGRGLGSALAIKYIPTKFAAEYRTLGHRLKISETPGFTWGRGTYVTPLAFPLSTAIFGRVGVVAEIGERATGERAGTRRERGVAFRRRREACSLRPATSVGRPEGRGPGR